MEEEKFYTIILRHDESTKWMINNPILALGEYGVEDDTHRIKRGDGKTKWSELNYEHFGLEYMITYANLQGKVEDNRALKSALDTKISYEVFSDIQNSVIAGITINSEDGKIGKITKTIKDVATAGTKQNYLLIQSEDQSIQGFWSIDETGMKILDLKANASIDDYQPKRKYYVDQICFYDNKLYRAVTDFEAGVVFNPEQWVILASLHSEDIRYDNKISGLESKTVKTALDELKDLDDEKVQKTRRPYKVYGTNEDGEQMLYDKDELRTVDSVNGIEANPTSKNIQIDADDINYDDEAEVKQSIREVLDSKVDKVVAGEGAKIVRDVTLNYNEEDGSIELVEDKVSLEDGSSEEQRTSVDVVSEQELANTKSELQANIDANKQEINDRVDQEVETLNNRIDTEVETLNTTISNNKEDIERKLQEAKSELQTNIDNNKIEINTRVDEEVETLNNTINDKEDALNLKIDTNEQEINARVDREVADLNTTITNNKIEINDKVDTIKSETDQTIADNKADIEDKLQKGLDTKIDKDIADSIVTNVQFSNENGDKLNEPTLKITSKNTDTETEIIHHMHFKQKGDLNITRENDHLLFDSSVIDLKVKTNADKIATHDTEIAALQEHDLNHDRLLATHTEQIANHETRVAANEEHLVEVDTTIAQMKEQHSNDINEVKTVNADQEAHLTRLDQTDDEHDERIQANADAIVETNKNVASNLRRINENQAAIESNDADISDLQTNKADKIFAQDANNKVSGDIKFESLIGNEIAKLGLVDIDPTNNSGTPRQLTFKSTDNTLVSVPITDEEGNITGYDLATNLDIDVNYFVTTQILDTTIPSENIVPFDSLTSTDKEKVELHDIISDSEGTWSRVKSIDEEAGTCVTITYAKHAQAVWGTVKGNIAEQQDLQNQFNDLKTSLSNDITAEESARVAADNTMQKQIANKVDKSIFDNIESAKVDEGFSIQKKGFITDLYTSPSISNKQVGIYLTGLSPQSNTMRYIGTTLLIKTDYDNGLKIGTEDYHCISMKLVPENINFDPLTSGLSSKKIPLAIRELKGITDDLNTNKLSKSANTDIIYGTDEAGNQIVYDKNLFGKVDTVNGIEIDENKNITLDATNIDSGFKSGDLEGSNINDVLDYLDQTVKYLQTQLDFQIIDYEDDTVDTITTATKFITYTREDGVMLMAMNIWNGLWSFSNTEPTVYENFMKDVENGYMRLIGIPEQVGNPIDPTNPNWNQVQEITISSISSSDGTNPVIHIYEDLNQTGPTCGIDILNNSNMDTLKFNGEIDGEIGPNGTTAIYPSYMYSPSDLQDEQSILNMLNFEYI